VTQGSRSAVRERSTIAEYTIDLRLLQGVRHRQARALQSHDLSGMIPSIPTRSRGIGIKSAKVNHMIEIRFHLNPSAAPDPARMNKEAMQL
jgi:hypothetical protein